MIDRPLLKTSLDAVLKSRVHFGGDLGIWKKEIAHQSTRLVGNETGGQCNFGTCMLTYILNRSAEFMPLDIKPNPEPWPLP